MSELFYNDNIEQQTVLDKSIGFKNYNPVSSRI